MKNHIASRLKSYNIFIHYSTHYSTTRIFAESIDNAALIFLNTLYKEAAESKKIEIIAILKKHIYDSWNIDIYFTIERPFIGVSPVVIEHLVVSEY